ncbi:DNA repair protein XRCC1 [Microplitis mediator]|uniref:DNA repair protein XRCC1 n=1 Tax=Microplitis mediator TaxID=375433 RepID=UPI0025530719|nr:DNA repair protein XRCC1 [Microplitis mediator]
MIIKLEKIISCSSEHPNYPASNLLHNPPPGPWKCAKPGEMLATVIFHLPEPTCIIGLDVGNYRSCVVVITASTSDEPDNWVPIVNHQFLTHDEAANNKFKDQVQLFTKKELNSDTMKIKFDRVKVTCMQSANLKELFGLSFITLRTEVEVDMGIDVFGRFKLKTDDSENKSKLSFKERYMKLFPDKQKSYKEDLVDKIKETGVNNFNKRQESDDKKPKKRPLLEKLEAGKSDEVFGKKNDSFSSTSGNNYNNDSSNNKNGRLCDVARTPFGDIIPAEVKRTPKQTNDKQKTKIDKVEPKASTSKPDESKNKLTNRINSTDGDGDGKCSVCAKNSDVLCKTCKKLPAPNRDKSPPCKKPKVAEVPKARKEFSKLLEDVTFSLSGYVNPQRDEIRRKAFKMGAKYVADPNTTTNRCTHLICAFKNTPKHQQLKGHAKIVSHIFIEECFDHKKRYPWRRYALSGSERKADESEEEIEGSTSPAPPPNPYEQETDSDSDGDY